MNEAQKFLYVREHHCNHLCYSEIASLHGSLPFDFSRNSLYLHWLFGDLFGPSIQIWCVN